MLVKSLLAAKLAVAFLALESVCRGILKMLVESMLAAKMAITVGTTEELFFIYLVSYGDKDGVRHHALWIRLLLMIRYPPWHK